MKRAALLCSLAALVLACTFPGLAAATGGDGGPRDEVRVEGTCSGAADVELRVRREDDAELRVDLVLDAGRRGERWTVVIVHERRLAFRGRLRASRGSVRITLRRTLDDLFGRDTVSVRATGPRGATCRVTARIGEPAEQRESAGRG
jgi:hypothetical protein